MASRRNEIKKDLWKIFKEVYQSSYFVEITDKQNDLLDQMVAYLAENYSLRRKGEKGKDAEEADNDTTPLERPLATPMRPYDYKEYRKLSKGVSSLPMPEPVKMEPAEVKQKPVPATPKKSKKTKDAGIDISALPAHLRKYVKS